MKDLYSFSKDEKEHNDFYELAKAAYTRVFKRVGIGEKTYLTFASGGMFAKFSHEFQTVTDAGEDIIYINQKHNIAINKEVYTDEIKKDLRLDGDFVEAKSVEVGNIFTLGDRFSSALGLTYKTESGGVTPVFMGSYGIGPARLMGTIVEVLSDAKGIVWPESVAPYQVHLLNLATDDEHVNNKANALYDALLDHGVEVLYDDRAGLTAGEKFNDSDLIGIPLRVVVSKKTLAEEGRFETKSRKSGEVTFMSQEELLERFTKK